MAAPPTAIRGVSVNSQNERRRKRYAEDPDYRKALLERNRAGRAAVQDIRKLLAEAEGQPAEPDASLAA